MGFRRRTVRHLSMIPIGLAATLAASSTPQPIGPAVSFQVGGFMESIAQLTPITLSATGVDRNGNPISAAPGSHYVSVGVIVYNLQSDRPAPGPGVAGNGGIVVFGADPRCAQLPYFGGYGPPYDPCLKVVDT